MNCNIHQSAVLHVFAQHNQGHRSINSKPVLATLYKRPCLLALPFGQRKGAVSYCLHGRADVSGAMTRSETSLPSSSWAEHQRAAAAVLAIVLLCSSPCTAARAIEQRSSVQQAASSSSAPMPVYFGNGCFWGRQKDYVDQERAMGRRPEQVSAVVGYAGGKQQGTWPLTCVAFLLLS